MGSLARFGVSLEKDLLNRFDTLIKEEGYTNRSEAIRDLIRERFVRKEWECDREVVGVITLLYDHHNGGLMERLTDVQHDYGRIISSVHVHLKRDRCLEVIVVRDKSRFITALAHQIKSIRGIKQCRVSMGSLGENI